MKTEEQGHRRQQLIQEVRKYLLEGKSEPLLHPTLPAESQEIAMTPAADIALIAAVLRLRVETPVDAVLQAFELLQLAEGGRHTLTGSRGAGTVPSYDKGVHEADKYRQAELKQCVETRVIATAEIINLDDVLAEILPEGEDTRVKFFEEWVANKFDLTREELEPVFVKWRNKSVSYKDKGLFLSFLHRAKSELPKFKAQQIIKLRTESGHKGAQAAKNSGKGKVSDPANDKRLGPTLMGVKVKRASRPPKKR